MEVLNRIAWDDKGQLVYAKNGIRKSNYTCPNCKEQLIFRRSDDLTKKGAKRPHFAHPSSITACGPESILHHAFKDLIHDRLKAAIDQRKPVLIKWWCRHCRKEHERNLVRTSVRVKMEHVMMKGRPDVGLINKKEATVAAIEVVVEHMPESNVIAFYKDLNTVLIRFDLKSYDDLSRALEPVLTPDEVDYCIDSKRCSDCREYQKIAFMEIKEVACGKCGVISKAAFLYAGADRLSKPATPEHFSSEELDQAKAEGVSIRLMYNRIMEVDAFANACSGCLTPFDGPWHPLAWRQAAAVTLAGSKEIKSGFFCEPCSNRRSRKVLEQLLGAIKERLSQIAEPDGTRHCIRCNAIVTPGHIYCDGCYKIWVRYHNANYPEHYCHRCGKSAETTKENRWCETCKQRWSLIRRRRLPLELEQQRLTEFKNLLNHRIIWA